VRSCPSVALSGETLLNEEWPLMAALSHVSLVVSYVTNIQYLQQDFSKFFIYCPCIFNEPLKFLCDPQLAFTKSLFLRNIASVDTSRLIISACCFPVTAAIVLYVIKRWLAQHFHHTNIGRILLLLLECVTPALCLLYQELLPLLSETGKGDAFN
jgi:hypothetical protein